MRRLISKISSLLRAPSKDVVTDKVVAKKVTPTVDKKSKKKHYLESIVTDHKGKPLNPENNIISEEKKYDNKTNYYDKVYLKDITENISILNENDRHIISENNSFNTFFDKLLDFNNTPVFGGDGYFSSRTKLNYNSEFLYYLYKNIPLLSKSIDFHYKLYEEKMQIAYDFEQIDKMNEMVSFYNGNYDIDVELFYKKNFKKIIFSLLLYGNCYIFPKFSSETIQDKIVGFEILDLKYGYVNMLTSYFNENTDRLAKLINVNKDLRLDKLILQLHWYPNTIPAFHYDLKNKSLSIRNNYYSAIRGDTNRFSIMFNSSHTYYQGYLKWYVDLNKNWLREVEKSVNRKDNAYTHNPSVIVATRKSDKNSDIEQKHDSSTSIVQKELKSVLENLAKQNISAIVCPDNYDINVVELPSKPFDTTNVDKLSVFITDLPKNVLGIEEKTDKGATQLSYENSIFRDFSYLIDFFGWSINIYNLMLKKEVKKNNDSEIKEIYGRDKYISIHKNKLYISQYNTPEWNKQMNTINQSVAMGSISKNNLGSLLRSAKVPGEFKEDERVEPLNIKGGSDVADQNQHTSDKPLKEKK